MDVTPLIPAGRQIIQAYKPGRFTVSGQAYDGPVLVFPGETLPWDVLPGALAVEDFAALATRADQLDIVLLGYGAPSETPPLALRAALKKQGLAVDIMDTGAACRTYNVLMAEDRRVVAALIPIS